MFPDKIKWYVVSVIALASTCQAIIVIGQGSCPDPPTKSDFVLADYAGLWYELERFPNTFEVGQVCVTAKYTQDSAVSVEVVNKGYFPFWFFGRRFIPNGITGSAVTPDASKPGELRVGFFGANDSGPANYHVLLTDYTGYAVVYSCSETLFGLANIQQAWILTREQGVAPATLAGIKDDLKSKGVPVEKFKPTRQTNCPPADIRAD